jgi:small subunit ribosomal protein S18
MRIKRRGRIKLNCLYCHKNKQPDYKETEILAKFVSDRGKIMSRSKSGVCAKHQRRLAVEIKRARHLALLPFMVKV